MPLTLTVNGLSLAPTPVVYTTASQPPIAATPCVDQILNSYTLSGTAPALATARVLRLELLPSAASGTSIYVYNSLAVEMTVQVKAGSPALTIYGNSFNTGTGVDVKLPPKGSFALVVQSTNVVNVVVTY
jgi:hypothetical protein